MFTVMAKLSSLEIVAPTKKRISVIWDYFGIQKGKDDSLVCRFCHTRELAHLKTNHSSLYQECRQAIEQKTVANTTKESKKF